METFSALLAICAGNSPVPVNSPHKGQWRGALMFSLICVWINGWVNNREAGDLRRYRVHYDVIVMFSLNVKKCQDMRNLSKRRVNTATITARYDNSWDNGDNSHPCRKTETGSDLDIQVYATYCDTIWRHTTFNLLKPEQKWPTFPNDISNAFSSIKCIIIGFEYKWSLFLCTQSTLWHHWFR